MPGLWQNARVLLTSYQYLLLVCREPTRQHHKGSKLQLNFIHSPCVHFSVQAHKSLTGPVLPLKKRLITSNKAI